MDPVRLWLGTYPSSDDAPEQPSGVRRVDLLPDGALVDRGTAAELPYASWVELHPSGRTLWATSETPDGRVVAYDVDGDTLTEVARLAAGGDYPCHLAIVAGPHDGALLVSNYGSGTFTVVPLDADGRPTGDGVTHVHLGSGPNPDRQDEAHVHSAWELPGGASAWVADLGTDEPRRYSLRPSGTEGEERVEADGIGARATPGSGPRHVAVHPDGVAFVVGELDSRVTTFVLDADGAGVAVGEQAACTTPPSERGSYPAHVSLSADGTRLHVTVRGPDVLATFAVERDAEGRPTVLRHLADTPLGASWPRHHALVAQVGADGAVTSGEGDDLVLVASQVDACLVAVRVAEDGTGEVVGRLTLPVKPSCVAVA
ncbi:lactonase family protein [Sanguibacter massiliensis]|uniref:lactonase family protein n=1 Tax=Sanguibacter massiliensis TaxID=1973217 RepID=UPI0013ED6656|nr:beta-propeller fold lactonase family protein [Sanguibacter massiliensis]